MPDKIKQSRGLVTAAVLLFTVSQSIFARPVPVTEQPVPMKRAPVGTNIAPWHSIKVSPGKHLPKIHFYDKFNPVWWLQNADDPVPPSWYLPGGKHRNIQWWFRNPMHNFDFYVIGVADKKIVRSGRYPDQNFNPNGGWDFEVARHRLVLLPFVSYQRSWCRFYLGWRERGAFGVEMKFHHTPQPKPVTTH